MNDNEYDMSSFITCEYCGNEWDGNAQCNCLESMLAEELEILCKSQETDEQIADLVPPNSICENSNVINSETDEQIEDLVAPCSICK